ncbi:potassium transporter Kup [Martelella soudanensis]|uniref:potassium transporter Kup n=1 Tax=unclassified Martelella TaxID=2629616 RepID=UPI0015DDFB88|nr:MULTISPECIES: potassium transporter Kup [unclassified Martelella]
MATGQDEKRPAGLAALSVSALGIVYGDIGTSPLYAFRTALGMATPDETSVLGILSMIVWSLVIVVSLKYLLLVMRADNNGEGGVLALLALLQPWSGASRRGKGALLVIGLFGAALLYGDGMITPAISVLSAVEGIQTIEPTISDFVVPITIVILLGLFSVQWRGTARVAVFFGPIMLVWFLAIALLGLAQIIQHPVVLKALSPLYAVEFGIARPGITAMVMGAVFLAVTGCEALYADMGHFGRPPIRLAWFACVFPCLVINYFGQGALVLSDSAHAGQTFYGLAPGFLRIPLVLLATAATIIASQAVISGAFSLTRQAVQLGQFPRVEIRQTSAEETGQIYVPSINLFLAISTVALVLAFRSSENLAAAYGIAVSTTMVITTILLYFVMVYRWKWKARFVLPLIICLALIDMTFLVANSLKIMEGGWLPLAVGVGILVIMRTWASGRGRLITYLNRNGQYMEAFLDELRHKDVPRVPGTAVFLTASLPHVPPALLHQFWHLPVLHERVILLHVESEEVPKVNARQRLEVRDLGQNFSVVHVHYGFMQSPNIPVALRLLGEIDNSIDLEHVTYFVGHETIIPSQDASFLHRWQEKLFALLTRNAVRATAFYKLPPEKVVELGMQIEI